MTKVVAKWLLICVLMTLAVGCQHKRDIIKIASNHGNMPIKQPKKDMKITRVMTNQGVESNLAKLDSKKFIHDQVLFESTGKELAYEPKGEILAGILPHHDVACDYMTSFYQTVAKCNTEEPELIILIGPNHPGEGPRFQVGAFDFITHSGVVNSDKDMIKVLVDHPLIHEGIESVFEKEHSIGIHMNYIHHYFEKAKVISCIIGETRNSEGIGQVAQKLVEGMQNKKVLIIASIDFSHYLTLEEANEKDAYTKELILASDTYTMSNLSNDYIDSPSTYVLLIELLQQLGVDYTSDIINHGNTATISGNLNMKETTSYFQVSYSGE